MCKAGLTLRQGAIKMPAMELHPEDLAGHLRPKPGKPVDIAPSRADALEELRFLADDRLHAGLVQLYGPRRANSPFADGSWRGFLELERTRILARNPARQVTLRLVGYDASLYVDDPRDVPSRHARRRALQAIAYGDTAPVYRTS